MEYDHHPLVLDSLYTVKCVCVTIPSCINTLCVTFLLTTGAIRIRYVNYGPLFAAISGKRYHLVAHAVTVTRGTAVANAFVKNGTMLYPVMLASTSSVTLELRGVPSGVTGFEAMSPGPNTSWEKVAAATKGLDGAWTVQITFADARRMHAALVRSIDRSL